MHLLFQTWAWLSKISRKSPPSCPTLRNGSKLFGRLDSFENSRSKMESIKTNLGSNKLEGRRRSSELCIGLCYLFCTICLISLFLSYFFPLSYLQCSKWGTETSKNDVVYFISKCYGFIIFLHSFLLPLHSNCVNMDLGQPFSLVCKYFYHVLLLMQAIDQLLHLLKI